MSNKDKVLILKPSGISRKDHEIIKNELKKWLDSGKPLFFTIDSSIDNGEEVSFVTLRELKTIPEQQFRKAHLGEWHTLEEAGTIDVQAAQRFTERNYNRFINLNKKITDARKRNV